MEFIINFIHWTPLGIITVPLFEIYHNNDVSSYKSDLWLRANGFIVAIWWILIMGMIV